MTDPPNLHSPAAAAAYIVIEGGEGVGKTTQVAAVAERLRSVGRPTEIIREPGGDPFAEAGRRLLLGDLDRAPETEVLLFNALRAQVLLSRVRPCLARGVSVVADRSHLSTIAYQGYGHGLDLAWTRSVCDIVTQLCAPTTEVILDLPPETADLRRAERGTSDRFERLGRDFHSRVRLGYLKEAGDRGLVVVDATGSIEHVTDEIWARLVPTLAPPHSGH